MKGLISSIKSSQLSAYTSKVIGLEIQLKIPKWTCHHNMPPDTQVNIVGITVCDIDKRLDIFGGLSLIFTAFMQIASLMLNCTKHR